MPALPPTPRIAVVGATGLVGQEMVSIIAERDVPRSELRLLASARSAGTVVTCGEEPLTVQPLTAKALEGVDLALLAVESDLSRTIAPQAVRSGAVVVDNSSAFRMAEGVPLIVPEVNGSVLEDVMGPAIIANPNCSTIIAIVAVTPLHRAVGVQRMVVSTYQAASGGGLAMLQELEQQVEDHAAGRPYRQTVLDRPYLFNLFSHDSPVGPDGCNTEETKLVRETRKIWGDDTVEITATCVRVPVLRAHSEAINLTLRSPLDEDRARRILADTPGVALGWDWTSSSAATSSARARR
jgi:aspartate-semialdehyde dehydrogenase